jgi:hypothetical protein
LTDRVSRKQYARHAERYGCEDVLETALEEGWAAEEYLYLVGAMRRTDEERFERERAANPSRYIEPPWKPSRAQVDLLVDRSRESDPALVARLLGITRQTVIRRRQAALEAGEIGQNDETQGAGPPRDSAA